MEIKLNGAITEKSSPEEEDELIEVLASKLEGAAFYKRAVQPGIYNMTFDWLAVINLTGSVLTIGQILWAAYKKVITSRKSKNPDSKAKLLFQLRDEQDNFVQIVLGDEFKTEEEFLPEFQKRIETSFKQSKDGTVSIKKVIDESIQWKRIK